MFSEPTKFEKAVTIVAALYRMEEGKVEDLAKNGEKVGTNPVGRKVKAIARKKLVVVDDLYEKAIAVMNERKDFRRKSVELLESKEDKPDHR